MTDRRTFVRTRYRALQGLEAISYWWPSFCDNQMEMYQQADHLDPDRQRPGCETAFLYLSPPIGGRFGRLSRLQTISSQMAMFFAVASYYSVDKRATRGLSDADSVDMLLGGHVMPNAQ